MSDDQWSAFQDFREGIKQQSFGRDDEKGNTIQGLIHNLPRSADGLDCMRDIQHALLNPAAQIKALRAYEAMAAQRSILKTLTAPAKEGGFNMKQKNAEKFLENTSIPFNDDPVKLAEELKQIGKGNADKTQPVKISVAYLRDNKEIVRDIRQQLKGRQLSAKQFKEIGATDSEVRDLLYGADMKTLQKFGYSIPKYLDLVLNKYRDDQKLLAQVDDPGFMPGALIDDDEAELQLDDLGIDEVEMPRPNDDDGQMSSPNNDIDPVPSPNDGKIQDQSREDDVVEISVMNDEHQHEVADNDRPIDGPAEEVDDEDDNTVLNDLTHETKGSTYELSKQLVDLQIEKNPKLKAEVEQRPELREKLYKMPGLMENFEIQVDEPVSDPIEIQNRVNDEGIDDDDDDVEELYDDSLIKRDTDMLRTAENGEEENYYIGDPIATGGETIGELQIDSPEGTPDLENREDNFQNQINSKSENQHPTKTSLGRTSRGVTENGTTSGQLELPPKIVADRPAAPSNAENIEVPENDDVSFDQVNVRPSSVSGVSDIFTSGDLPNADQ
ncbi:hypothetical protein AB1L42_01325 [Thalassoglobus sp. JC818]|uniref:hypothetical protein n=1 Tax=Thalassoglobus sp. JC818 TaxID=3232136 RepID=UPI003459F664